MLAFRRVPTHVWAYSYATEVARLVVWGYKCVNFPLPHDMHGRESTSGTLSGGNLLGGKHLVEHLVGASLGGKEDLVEDKVEGSKEHQAKWSMLPLPPLFPPPRELPRSM